VLADHARVLHRARHVGSHLRHGGRGNRAAALAAKLRLIGIRLATTWTEHDVALPGFFVGTLPRSARSVRVLLMTHSRRPQGARRGGMTTMVKSAAGYRRGDELASRTLIYGGTDGPPSLPLIVARSDRWRSSGIRSMDGINERETSSGRDRA